MTITDLGMVIIALRYLIKKEFQAAIALSVISIFPIIFKSYIRSNHVQVIDGSFAYPFIVGICISTHHMIADALDHIFKSDSYLIFGSRYILILGSLICGVMMVAAMSGENSLGSLITFVTLQIQVILILMGLSSYLDKFLVGDKWALRLGNFAYFFLLASTCLSTLEYILIIPNKLPIAFTVLALLLSSLVCMISAIYSWLKCYRVADDTVSQSLGLNMSTQKGEGNMAPMALLYIVYSAGVALYNIALIHPTIFNIQNMNLMMVYLNCIFVYLALLQEGIIARMNFIDLKVLLHSYLLM